MGQISLAKGIKHVGLIHTYKKNKLFLLVFLYIILVLGMRLVWANYYSVYDQPNVSNGIIDLQDWHFDDQTIFLNGDWLFYPDTFIDPSPGATQDLEAETVISVPESWQSVLNPSQVFSNYGYGSYRLRIQLPEVSELTYYGIKFNRIHTAAEVYVDGQLITSFNEPTTSFMSLNYRRGSFTTFFATEKREVELVIHASNYDIPFTGGISRSVKFGTLSAIQNEGTTTETLQIIVSVIFLLHCLYAFIVYFFVNGRQSNEFLYYGLLLLFSALSILIDDEVIIQLPIPIQHSYRLLLLIFFTILFLFFNFVQLICSEQLWQRQKKQTGIIFTVISVTIVLLPIQYYLFLIALLMLLYILAIVNMYWKLIKAIRSNNQDAIFVLFFLTSYVSNIIFGLLIKMFIVDFPFYPLDFIFTVFFAVMLIIRKHLNMIHVVKKQSEKLLKADQQKDEFLAHTSHELRNPLHALINIAYTMLHNEEGTLTSEEKDNLRLLIQIGEQMRYTLNDITDLTRLEAKHLQLNQRNVDLATTLETVLGMLKVKIEHKQVAVYVDIPEHMPELYADENRFVQILFNLIQNALKYTHGGSITIRADYKFKHAIIKVADTGVGISQEDQERIFEPYEQGQINHAEGGLGLGLHICRKLIELHGGTIQVNSKLGSGTTFTITLPTSTHETLHSSKKEKLVTSYFIPTPYDSGYQKQTDSKSDGKILIVDDDMINLKILTSILKEAFYVEVAQSGKEALENIQAGRFDLIISDVMMPNMSGYQLTEEIRENYSISELPILLLTARSQLEDIQMGFRVGANDYITKPVNPDELMARVRALIKLKLSIADQLKTEGAWLQAQIQPHFIFNTINAIASLSEIDTARMLKLLNQFSIYLRKSFASYNTKELISLTDELELVEAYIYIEQERFGDRIESHIEVERDSSVFVPPLSIQTLVENAIRHGILKKAEGGKVTITAKIEKGYHRITIQDNGVGMSKQQVEALLSQQNANVNLGIGLTNTNKRLKQLFGTGLKIESSLKAGTTVSFTVPKKQRNQNERFIE